MLAITRHTRLLAAATLLAAALPAAASLPGEPPKRAEVVGQPQALAVQPEAVVLTGPRSHVQVAVTGKYADGNVRDLTHFGELSVEGGVATVAPGGFLTPVKDGAGALVVKAG